MVANVEKEGGNENTISSHMVEEIEIIANIICL